MTDAPCLFDQLLLHTRLKRALKIGATYFLLERVADDFELRLEALARSFETVADIGTLGPHAALKLFASQRFKNIIRQAPLAEVLGTGAWQNIIGETSLVPFAPQSLDAVVSLLAFQWVDDLPGLLIQIKRALKADGLFIACLLGGQTLHELRDSFARAEIECEGGLSPRVSPFADLRDIGALMQRAGFALPVVDTETITVRYQTPLALFSDLRAMGGTNVLIERRKTPLRRKTLLRALGIYAENYSDADGRIRATFECLWVSGWRPHESQQKPLQPGSAKTRLADALNTKEGILD
ncbi:MAG: methyltransferase domain-containing protein [Alphaproteobacteria bacterium]|nr:methyltransferase domain-containing protein [Alphaproteobacteria bacterium]